MLDFRYFLTLIRLGFLRVVFPGGVNLNPPNLTPLAVLGLKALNCFCKIILIYARVKVISFTKFTQVGILWKLILVSHMTGVAFDKTSKSRMEIWLKKRLRDTWFPVSFDKILKNIFLQSTSFYKLLLALF